MVENVGANDNRGLETPPTDSETPPTMTPQEIKNRLTKTWHSFFSRFGNFTPIQEMAIPSILNNENVVVISPAASGKTEAVIAPLLENLLAQKNFDPATKQLKILYISPTRALVNDLYRRFIDPISYLGIELGRKTGDHPKIDPKNLPHVLLTTPESFDSMLTRHTKILLDLDSLVLDEIHLLDNTPRGDQLRVLLNRLRKIKNNMQYCALSATIDDLNLGARYFDNPKVCFLKSVREIEYLLMPHENFTKELLRIFQKQGFNKILVFFNARSLVELLSQKLNQPPFEGNVLVHHASLPREKREEVEKIMNQSTRAILCATSTLELGIDIGDIDCIVLFRPPFNVSSLLQRIGRGNRRQDKLFAIGIYMNDWEKTLFETFFECAQDGRLYEKRYQPTLSVIPQQIYSYLYQRRRIGTTLKSLNTVFSPAYTEEQIKTVFKTLIDESLVRETRPGIYFDTDRLEKKISLGKIHSNIADISYGEYDVYDVVQATQIGRVYYLQEKFILGGRSWQTVQVIEKEKKVYAKFIGNASAVVKLFEGKGAGNYNYLLAPVLKQKIMPGLAALEFPCAFDGTSTHILHVLGSLYGFILAEALSKEGIEAIDIDGKMLVLNRYQITDNRFLTPKFDSIKKVIHENIARFEDALGSGAYFYDLPITYQIEDHCLNLDVQNFLKFTLEIKVVEIELPAFKDIIAKLK